MKFFEHNWKPERKQERERPVWMGPEPKPLVLRKRHYWERRNIRQAFRETCFVHFASGYTSPAKNVRHYYLMALVLCYGFACVRRNINRITAAMYKVEMAAKYEADLVASWGAMKYVTRD